jgi:hypothetical protein
MKQRKPTDLNVPVARAIRAACLSAGVGPRVEADAARRAAGEDEGADEEEGASASCEWGGRDNRRGGRSAVRAPLPTPRCFPLSTPRPAQRHTCHVPLTARRTHATTPPPLFLSPRPPSPRTRAGPARAPRPRCRRRRPRWAPTRRGGGTGRRRRSFYVLVRVRARVFHTLPLFPGAPSPPPLPPQGEGHTQTTHATLHGRRPLRPQRVRAAPGRPPLRAGPPPAGRGRRRRPGQRAEADSGRASFRPASVRRARVHAEAGNWQRAHAGRRAGEAGMESAKRPLQRVRRTTQDAGRGAGVEMGARWRRGAGRRNGQCAREKKRVRPRPHAPPPLPCSDDHARHRTLRLLPPFLDRRRGRPPRRPRPRR